MRALDCMRADTAQRQALALQVFVSLRCQVLTWVICQGCWRRCVVGLPLVGGPCATLDRMRADMAQRQALALQVFVSLRCQVLERGWSVRGVGGRAL